MKSALSRQVKLDTSPHVEHSIESLDEYVLVLDIFSPPRSDIAQRLGELED